MKNLLILVLFLALIAVVGMKILKPQTSVPSTAQIPAQEQPQDQPQESLYQEEITVKDATPDEIQDFRGQQVVNIRIVDYEYIPQKVRVSLGTTVIWTNESAMEHNVMQDHDESEIPHGAPVEHDPNIFEGPMLKTGESYSFTFNEVSSNPYHCSPHPWMTGVVEVSE